MDPASSAPANANLRNTALVFLGVLALISLVAALVAANIPGKPKVRSAGGTTPTSPPPASVVSVSPAITGNGTTENTGQGGGYDSGQAGQTGPQIVYFRLKQQPRCGNKPVAAIIEWKISGATGTSLSVDNPGIVGSYRSYQGTTGSETFTFSCGGSTEKHTYTLYTTGGGPQRSETITATATTTTTDPPKPSTKPSAPPASAPPGY
jgi:hypothetical protein